ncbi:DNA cytosine methyltransferase [Streptomyces sp. SID5785]|uniref:DNA cytosine methyltransferase n=1 Tax=Streptomyces sp. SID5785 TaxID=2690309 RepID=UPI001F010730|nr:DNA cytosine methyltransferase [Streptomyces sp. SID5785]
MNNPEAQVPAPTVEEFDVLDLFAGPGGLDVAAHFSNLRSIGIEWDGNACETRYRAGLPTIHADVTVMRSERWNEVPHARMLTGGPPCQSFSIAGKGAGRKALDTVTALIDELIDTPDDERIDKELSELDPRTGLVLEPLRYLIKAITSGRGPYERIVLEQVPTVFPLWLAYEKVLTSGRLTKFLPASSPLSEVRYEVVVDVLRTEEYGVAQTRKRAVLIARLATADQDRQSELELPKPTHLRFGAKLEKKKKKDDETIPGIDVVSKAPEKSRWRSIHDALSAARTELALSHDTIDRPGDFHVVSNYGSGGVSTNRGIRKWDQPSFTVTGKVSRNRLEDSSGNTIPRFTIHEAGVLQSFPGNYPWAGNDQAQQVGNAVPPVFGMHVLGAAFGRTPELPDELNLTWPPVDRSLVEMLRRRGCGHADGCPTRHPATPADEEDGAGNGSDQGASLPLPRTGASTKSPSK